MRETLDITVRLGSGHGPTPDRALDQALRTVGAAGATVATSPWAVPAASRVRTLHGGAQDHDQGALSSVRAEAHAVRPGDVAWAGLGWCVDADGSGFLVEQVGDGEQAVVDQLEQRLAELTATRPGTYGRPQLALSSARCADLPVCAVAVAAYPVPACAVPTDPPGTAPERGLEVPAPVRVTVELGIDVETARRYYQLYRATFGPLATLAVARQILHEEEFLAEMVDPRVGKYVAWDAEGQVVGISTLTSDLSTVPWISPDFFAHRYPEHHARGAIYYMGFTLVSAGRQGERVFATMLRRMTERVRDEGAVVAWDMCRVNEEGGLAASGNALLAAMADVSIHTIDQQSYWAATFHGPAHPRPPTQ